MPKSPDPEGSPRLMTVTEIAAAHDVSRQTIHTYRRTGVFPSPVEGEGSTRLRFREDEVAAFFEANPKQPRKKRRPHQQGDPVTTTVDPRIALMSRLNTPPYDEVAGMRGTPLGEAAQLLAAYRASVVAEVVEALQERAAEYAELAEEQMRPSLEERAQEWYSAADVAEKLKRAKTVES